MVVNLAKARIQRPTGSNPQAAIDHGPQPPVRGFASRKKAAEPPEENGRPDVRGDTDKAVAFLDHYEQGGDWPLIAIHPETSEVQASRFDDRDRMSGRQLVRDEAMMNGDRVVEEMKKRGGPPPASRMLPFTTGFQ